MPCTSHPFNTSQTAETKIKGANGWIVVLDSDGVVSGSYISPDRPGWGADGSLQIYCLLTIGGVLPLQVSRCLSQPTCSYSHAATGAALSSFRLAWALKELCCTKVNLGGPSSELQKMCSVLSMSQIDWKGLFFFNLCEMDVRTQKNITAPKQTKNFVFLCTSSFLSHVNTLRYKVMCCLFEGLWILCFWCFRHTASSQHVCWTKQTMMINILLR